MKLGDRFCGNEDQEGASAVKKTLFIEAIDGTIYTYLEAPGQKRIRDKAKNLKPAVLGSECDLQKLSKEIGNFRIAFAVVLP